MNLIKQKQRSVIKNTFIKTVHKNVDTIMAIYNMSKNSSENNYIKIKLAMTNENFLLSYKHILYQLNRLYGIHCNEKKVLSAYMISSHPEHVLSVNIAFIEKHPKSYENILYRLSVEITEIFNDILCYDLVDDEVIKNIFSEYNVMFNMFITLDKKKKIDELIKEWYDNEITINSVTNSNKYSEEQKQDVLFYLNDHKNKIKNFIKSFDRNFNFNILNVYKKIYDNIDSSCRSIFWNTLTENLIDKDYDFFYLILTEIKNNLKSLDKKNSIDYDEVIDIDKIKQEINNNVTINDELLKICDYVVERIVFLQAPIRNEHTVNCWNILVSRMSEEKDNPYCYQLSIANCMKFISTLINEIFDDITDLFI
jgi:hypothetical protein